MRIWEIATLPLSMMVGRCRSPVSADERNAVQAAGRLSCQACAALSVRSLPSIQSDWR